MIIEAIILGVSLIICSVLFPIAWWAGNDFFEEEQEDRGQRRQEWLAEIQRQAVKK